MAEPERRGNFIRTIIEKDLESNKHGGKVITRFPPEPNGYLHIGHAKSICLNFGFAADYAGRCHLRFDDTNPSKEEIEYIDSIKDDVKWLGFDWGEHLYFASDYFSRFYDYAVQLVKAGKAYVCDLTAEEIHEHRGTLKEPGKESPFRNRTPEESLDLLERMKNGEFEDGTRVLRAKIDMASPNLNMRDPVIYRIRKESHPRTEDEWCIYPMYDFAHGLSDSIEGITHSICTLEFEDHRPLYDWFLDHLDVPCHPQQIEFARLNLNFTVMSKRLLKQLIDNGHVTGWDDPRMPTIKGLRRRGYTPAAIRRFADIIGLAKADSIVDTAMLESCVRNDLDPKTRRVMCVHKPLKVVLENYPKDRVEELSGPYFPNEPESMGYRSIPFSSEIYIERDDFLEEPPKKFFRLAPGREVRLRWSYIIKCVDVIKDDKTGEIVELRCTIDPETLNAHPPDGRKVRGIIHWVSAAHSLPAKVRLYDRLFTVPNPTGEKDRDFVEFLNPDSLEELTDCLIEPSLADARPGERYQFERKGYYFVDPVDSVEGAPVFNRIVSLRDTWAKIMKAAGK